MTDLIIDRLDQIRDRADAATPGPWFESPHEHDPVWSAVVTGGVDENGMDCEPTIEADTRPNAEFIAAARTDVPRMEAALRGVLDLHILDDQFPDDPVKKCVACNLSDREGLDPTRWPCPTVQAIATALGIETEGEER